MSLRQTIQNDLKQSMKQRQEEQLSALRLLWELNIKKEKKKRMELKMWLKIE